MLLGAFCLRVAFNGFYIGAGEAAVFMAIGWFAACLPGLVARNASVARGLVARIRQWRAERAEARRLAKEEEKLSGYLGVEDELPVRPNAVANQPA